jgi:hypothetical protein
LKFDEIKILLKNFLINQYDIRPSLADKTVEKMFVEAVNYISLEEQKEKDGKNERI